MTTNLLCNGYTAISVFFLFSGMMSSHIFVICLRIQRYFTKKISKRVEDEIIEKDARSTAQGITSNTLDNQDTPLGCHTNIDMPFKSHSDTEDGRLNFKDSNGLKQNGVLEEVEIIPNVAEYQVPFEEYGVGRNATEVKNENVVKLLNEMNFKLEALKLELKHHDNAIQQMKKQMM